MPIYDYQCDACGHAFERQQRMSEAPVKKCPECGRPVRRVIGAVAGIVRGASTPCARDASPCQELGRCNKRSCSMLEG
ncbi:MAG TPA: zinc ribbon domain-containing protein [Planctomycetota bacterium]|nr:zinc ribbon domain-containing protein [Planctomycetota bacterium]HRR80502.1 zinc ribbon domain-containing protein [Planctomycetota bacterium]HRT94906.1 zinc ribbon domain-containing protein [Planctomycetota bacterium]